jgi:hypothetical protein
MWKLKLLALEVIQKKTASRSQKRRRATHSLDPANAADSELRTHYDATIAKDALDALSWVNLGRLLYRQANLQDALACTLVAVAIVPHDAESWANVIGISRKLGENTLFGLALAAAHQSVGAEVFEYLGKRW